MRKHDIGSARFATISDRAEIADIQQAEENHPGSLTDANGEIFVENGTDFKKVDIEHLHRKVNQDLSHQPEMWLGCSLSALGSILTYVYLNSQKRHDIASEESLPPRPGVITSSIQILCITSLSISYGAMISSMTIFVLPKEAERFYPKQSSISLGFLELVAAVCLLCGPVAGQISVTWPYWKGHIMLDSGA